MIKKNLEVGDYITFKNIVYNDENVVISQDFAEAMSKSNKLTEVNEDFVKIYGFDEEIPKRWVKNIVRKYKTVDECSRASEINNRLHKINESRPIKLVEFLDFPGFELIAILVLGSFGILTCGILDGMGSPKRIIAPVVVMFVPLCYLYFKLVWYFEEKAAKFEKDSVEKVIKEFDISYEEARKMNYSKVLFYADKFYTEQEQEDGEKNLPYFVWSPTTLNTTDLFEKNKLEKASSEDVEIKPKAKPKTKYWRFK